MITTEQKRLFAEWIADNYDEDEDEVDYYELEAQGGANVCPRCAAATLYNPTDPHDGERLCAACTSEAMVRIEYAEDPVGVEPDEV